MLVLSILAGLLTQSVIKKHWIVGRWQVLRAADNRLNDNGLMAEKYVCDMWKECCLQGIPILPYYLESEIFIW